jgi:hypothetical protein
MGFYCWSWLGAGRCTAPVLLVPSCRVCHPRWCIVVYTSTVIVWALPRHATVFTCCVLGDTFDPDYRIAALLLL